MQRNRDDYLDWSLKIDLKKNKERSLQTSPIFIEGQSWTFKLDLGNNNSPEKSSNANAYREKGYQSFFGMQNQEETDDNIWFKMSVLLCSSNQSRQSMHQNYETETQERPITKKKKQLTSKKCKFIRKKSVPGTQGFGALSPTSKSVKSKSKTNTKTSSQQRFNSTFSNQPNSIGEIELQNDETNEVKPQIFAFELCAEVMVEGSNKMEWVTLLQETIISLKAPRSFPNLLIQLPKYLIAPVIHQDGRLNLRIKF